MLLLVTDSEVTPSKVSKIRFDERGLKICCFNKMSKHSLNY